MVIILTTLGEQNKLPGSIAFCEGINLLVRTEFQAEARGGYFWCTNFQLAAMTLHR
jgi:hypothetical protein